MALATRRTPERNSPLLSSVSVPKKTATQQTLSTAGGVITMTVAQLLQGVIPVDCQDAQTFTLPTAALIIAGIPGCKVGSAVDVDIINYGDTTMTIGLGTGVTKTTIATVAAVMTIATLCSKRFTIIVTGILANGDAADACVVWAHGSIAAAVA